MTRKQVTRPKLPRNNLGTRQRATVIPAQIRIADYPLLADLCWNVAIAELPARYAFAIYERNWRFVDLKCMKAMERLLLDRLMHKFGNGVINA